MRLARPHPLVLLFLGAGLVACGPGGDGAAGMDGPVRIDGSSTVFLIAEAAAEEFQMRHPEVRVTVGVSGSGGGFSRLCAGEIDIANASQPMTPEQVEACRRNGVEVIPLEVGWDGISLVVNPENRFVACLTLEELRRIWGEDRGVRTWQDVREEWPAREIELFGPGSDSGTFDHFTQNVLGPSGIPRSDFHPSEDDNVLVRGIAGEPYGFGYFGYAYFSENQDRLRLVALDDSSGCVLPTDESIESGRYGLSRRLYMYVDRASLAEPQVLGYVVFFLENAADLVSSTGYHALEPGAYASLLRDVLAEVPGAGA